MGGLLYATLTLVVHSLLVDSRSYNHGYIFESLNIRNIGDIVVGIGTYGTVHMVVGRYTTV